MTSHSRKESNWKLLQWNGLEVFGKRSLLLSNGFTFFLVRHSWLSLTSPLNISQSLLVSAFLHHMNLLLPIYEKEPMERVVKVSPSQSEEVIRRVELKWSKQRVGKWPAIWRWTVKGTPREQTDRCLVSSSHVTQVTHLISRITSHSLTISSGTA